MEDKMFRLISQPAEEARCARYKVAFNGQAADVLAARVSAMPFNWGWPGYQRPLDQTEIAGFVQVQSDGPVEVCVTVQTDFETVCVRPLSRKIETAVEGRTVRFTLPGPGQYTLEPDDFHEALHLFIAPCFTLPQHNENTLYYGPGVHHIGLVELHDDQTVILDAGAVVYGGFVAFDAKNITVTGAGILDGSLEERTDDTGLLTWSEYDVEARTYTHNFVQDPASVRTYIQENKVLNGCLRFYNCRNIEVSHITCRDAATFVVVPAACDNVLIDDIKLIGMWRYNSDGIDLFNTSNCVIRNSFLRNFDDCIVIKGIPGWQDRNNENILAENCVIWCDWGRAIEVGAETNASEYRNQIYRNCDVIHGSWVQLDIQHHNNANIHDIIFEDIRCEFTRHQLPFKMQDFKEQTFEEAKPLYAQPILLGAFFYNMGLFGIPHADDKITHVTFRNIQVLSDEDVTMPKCEFKGLTEKNTVEDVVVENLTRNGVRLTTPESANLHCNEFTHDIVLK